MKKLFQITYKDPDSEEEITVEKEFDHSEEFHASMWAEDWAYSMADKGPYRVREITRG